MSGATHVTVRVPLVIRHRPGRKTVVTPMRDGDEAAFPTRADPALVKALARAFRYQRLLDEGRYASISEMAAAERVERGYLGSLLRLTLLAPEVVQTLLDGRAPADLTLPRLLDSFPTSWGDQQGLFGCARAPEAGRTTRSEAPGTLTLIIPLSVSRGAGGR